MEIETMSKVSHQNVLTLHEVFEGEETFYLILDLMEGGNLRALLDKGIYGLDPNHCVTIMKKLLMGTKEIHKQGIMHRDLKPENILFKEKNNLNTLKISDFGLANFEAGNKTHCIYFKCGTPGYVAPEIANINSSDPN